MLTQGNSEFKLYSLKIRDVIDINVLNSLKTHKCRCEMYKKHGDYTKTGQLGI